VSVSDVAIRRPVFAWMLMAALIIFGALSFMRMGVSQLPDVDFPVVNVGLTLEGAAPEVMEMSVLDPVENALLSVEGIVAMSSNARSGSANVTVEFELGRDIDSAVQDIQAKLARAQRELPLGTEPPVVTKNNPEDNPILWLSVVSERLSPPELMAYVRDTLQPRFQTVEGVADITLGGYVDPELRVWVSQRKLDRYALGVGDVIGAIRTEHAEPPSGRIEDPLREYNVRTMGEARTPEEFGRITINRRGGGPNFAPISLDKVARVEDGLADVRRMSRAMGQNAVGLGIRKQRGVNAVAVGQAVKRRLAEQVSQLPEGTQLAVNFDTTSFIEESIHELNFTLALSALLTALVCWAFLGSWSATLNVILAIPTSVVGSFIVLRALGFTLNTFTLLGLSLAIGIVVDDAIMVLENIVRHLENRLRDARGEGDHSSLVRRFRELAALEGAREIAFAALAATAAIIAIFLPVAFMKGLIGRYFYQFGVTLSVAVAISLLEALTLTPMRCSRFLEISERTSAFGRWVEGAFSGLARAYGRVLPTLIRHAWKTVGLAALFFAATYLIVGALRKELVPPQDQGRILLRLRTAEGSSLAFTDARLREVERIVAARPEVLRYFGSVGGFSGGDVNSANLFITLKPRDQRKLSQQQLADELRKEFRAVKGGKVFLQDLSQAGFSARRGFPVEFNVQGPDWETLIAESRKLLKRMEETGLVVDADSDYRGNVEEVHIVPDRARAENRGVSVADIGETVSSLLGGTVAGKFSKGGHRYDIRVKLDPREGPASAELGNIMVRNNRGELIPLGDVVKVERVPGLLQISRQNRERAISVFGNVPQGASQAAALKAVQALGRDLPPGYRLVPGGSAQTFQESFDSLLMALLLGIVVSYMVLASQFNSFVHPVTVLVALPFSVSGAFVALWLGNQSLSIFSMIGLILLMGIVKKNSILLVDFANHLREQGRAAADAMIQAGPIRLRPILMTSFATVAGALPAALALGPGAESRIPMALAVIGGVLVSTALTLFVVPAVYFLFSRLERAR
jgi:hydrophobe/amphiphile efflux-1 (HAE1) family protein